MMSLTTRVKTRVRSKLNVHNDGDKIDDGLSDDALVEAYKLLYLKWNEECKASEKQKENIEVLLQDKARLIATVSKLKEEVDHLNLQFRKSLITRALIFWSHEH